MQNVFLAAAFASTISVFPWVIGGNYPFVRTFASSLIAVLLLVDLVHKLVKQGPRSSQSPEANLISFVLIAILAYCGIQTFIPGQIFSSSLPSASRERLSELVCGISYFVFAYRFFQDRERIAPFAIVIFLNGVLLAVFGIVQQLGWNGKLFWTYELVQGGIPFSSFVNRNNAAGYLVICFSVANFLLARHLFDGASSNLTSGHGLPKTNFSDQIRSAFENLESSHLYLFSGLLLIGVSVFFSQSRGGTLALIAAFFVGWPILLKTNRVLIVAMLILIVAGAGFVAFSDQSQDIADRMQTLSDPEQAGTPRIDHWSSVMPYVADSYLFGSGLGTYQSIYPQYLQTEFKDWFRHAENQYLETVAEVGIPGIIVLLTLMFLMFKACISAKSDPVDKAVSVVGLMALSGQAIAAIFDFGLYLPGNMVLLATVMGMTLARHSANYEDEMDTRQVVARNSWSWAILILVLAAGNLWGSYELSAVDSRRMAAHFIRRFDPANDRAKLMHHQTLLEYSTSIRPDDSEAYYQRGQLQILHYRSAAAEKLLDEANMLTAPSSTTTENFEAESANKTTGSVATPEIRNEEQEIADAVAAKGAVETKIETIKDIWPTTSLIALNRAAHVALRDTENPTAFESIVNAEEVSSLHQAWESFQLAEKYCPFLYRAPFKLAQLSVLMDRGQSEREMIEEAISRCSLNANLLYHAGLIEHHARNSRVTANYWGQVMRMTRRFDPQIILYSRYELSMKDFFEVILPQQPEFLFKLANKYFGSQEDLLPRQLLLNHIRRLLLEAPGQLSAPSNKFLLAAIEAEFGEFENSNKHFEQALKAIPNETSWRLAYARSLFQQQKYFESSKNLKSCLLNSQRSGAQTREIQKLLRRIEQLQQAEIRSKARG